jgi:hypothetical protein
MIGTFSPTDSALLLIDHQLGAMKPGRVRTAYLFGFNSTEKFEKVRDAYSTNCRLGRIRPSVRRLKSTQKRLSTEIFQRRFNNEK